MKLSDFDLNLLPVIVVIFEERSVTLAARRLGMSQPAVSKALARLRKCMGDQIFVRTSNGMEPTARTSSIIERARDMIALVQRDIISDAFFDPATTKTSLTFALSEVAELFFSRG